MGPHAALILVAFSPRVVSLRGVERFARAMPPPASPHLGLRQGPRLTPPSPLLLLPRLDPEKLQAKALLQSSTRLDTQGESLVTNKEAYLRGERQGKAPRMKLGGGYLALHLHTALAEARAEEGGGPEATPELLDLPGGGEAREGGGGGRGVPARS